MNYNSKIINKEIVLIIDIVLGICEGTVFEKRQLNISTKVDRCTTVQLLPSAVLLQIPC